MIDFLLRQAERLGVSKELLRHLPRTFLVVALVSGIAGFLESIPFLVEIRSRLLCDAYAACTVASVADAARRSKAARNWGKAR